jgi:hypothetical protein
MHTKQLCNLISLLLVMLTAACLTHKPLPVETAQPVSEMEKPYIDLEPGRTLRVIVPLLQSGGFLPHLTGEQTEGNTITLSSEEVIGYTTSDYSIEGKKDGKVRLELASTEETREGKTVPNAARRTLPFALPQRPGHIRLLYLIKYSEADHGTAILASERLDTLNAFTPRLIEKPSLCSQGGDVSCSWIPPGVGIRTEGP